MTKIVSLGEKAGGLNDGGGQMTAVQPNMKRGVDYLLMPDHEAEMQEAVAVSAQAVARYRALMAFVLATCGDPGVKIVQRKGKVVVEVER